MTEIETAAQPAGGEPSPATEASATITEEQPVDTPADGPETSPREAAAPQTPFPEPPAGAPNAEQSSRSGSNPMDSAAPETDTSAGPLVALLIALLAVGFFVLRALK